MQGLDLDRATDHGKIAGVCAGVADRWKIDPVLVRIGAVVLALCSGIGAVLYGAAWLLLPTKGAAEAPLLAKFPKAKQVPTAGWYVIVGVLCVIAMATLGQFMPISTGPVLAVAALWYFGIYRPGKRRAANDRSAGTPTTGPAGPPGMAGPPGPTGQAGPGVGPTGPQDGAPFTPYDPQPRFGTGVEPEGYPDQWPMHPGAGPRPDAAGPGRPRPEQQPSPEQTAGRPAASTMSRTVTKPRHDDHTARRVRTIAIAAVAVAVIGLGVLDGSGLLTVPLLGYAATALLIVGVALVISAWTGRARGLLPLGCLLLALTVVGIGTLADKSESPQFTQNVSYATVEEIPGPQNFDVAEVQVDMSGLDLDQDATYTVNVDSGTIVVTVPRDANVVINARVDVGSINALERQQQGVDLVQEFASRPDSGGPVLTLDLMVDVGSIRVVRS